MMNEGCPVFLEGALTGDSTTQFVFDNLGYGLGFPTAVLADTSGFSGPLLSDYVNVDDDSSNTTTYSPDHPPPSSVDASSLSGIVIVDGDVGLNVVDGAAAPDVLVLENGATVNASAIDAVMVEMNGDNDTLSANIGPDTMLSVTGTNDDLNGDTDAASQLAIDPDATLYASGDLAGAVLGAGSLYNNGNLTVSGGVGSFTGTYNVVGSSGNFTIEAVSGANLWMGTDNSGADQINAATFVLDSSNPTAGIIQVDDGGAVQFNESGTVSAVFDLPGSGTATFDATGNSVVLTGVPSTIAGTVNVQDSVGGGSITMAGVGIAGTVNVGGGVTAVMDAGSDAGTVNIADGGTFAFDTSGTSDYTFIAPGTSTTAGTATFNWMGNNVTFDVWCYETPGVLTQELFGTVNVTGGGSVGGSASISDSVWFVYGTLNVSDNSSLVLSNTDLFGTLNINDSSSAYINADLVVESTGVVNLTGGPVAGTSSYLENDGEVDNYGIINLEGSNATGNGYASVVTDQGSSFNNYGNIYVNSYSTWNEWGSFSGNAINYV